MKTYITDEELDLVKRLAELYYKMKNDGIDEDEHEEYEEIIDTLSEKLPVS